MPTRSPRRGFTLIELLLVIGIIAILASIVIVAINPTRQLALARNTQRRSDVNTILNAVYQFAIDNNGNMPGPTGSTNEIPVGTPLQICQVTTDPATCNTTWGAVSLRMLTGAYLVSIPKDPQVAVGTGTTRYNIKRDTNNRITVGSPGAELGVTIDVTR